MVLSMAVGVDERVLAGSFADLWRVLPMSYWYFFLCVVNTAMVFADTSWTTKMLNLVVAVCMLLYAVSFQDKRK